MRLPDDQFQQAVREVFVAHDPERANVATFQFYTRFLEGSNTQGELLDELYSMYPAALRNLVAQAYFRFAPDRMLETERTTRSCGTFAAVSEMLRAEFDLRADFLPQNTSRRLLLRCREVLLAYQPDADPSAIEAFVRSCGETAEDAVVRLFATQCADRASDRERARAAFWQAVFVCDATLVERVDELVQAAGGDAAAAMDAFFARRNAACPRRQLESHFQRMGLDRASAERHAAFTLKSQRYGGDVLSAIHSAQASTHRRRIVSPPAPFSSSIDGVIDRSVTPSSTIVRAELFTPQTADAVDEALSPIDVAKPSGFPEDSTATRVLAEAEDRAHASELEELRAVLKRSVAALEAREAELDQRAREIELRSVRSPNEAAALQRLRSELEGHEEELSILQDECEQRTRALVMRESAVAQQERTLAERVDAFDEQHAADVADLASKLRALREAEGVVGGREAAVAARERDVEAIQQRLDVQLVELRKEQASLREREEAARETLLQVHTEAQNLESRSIALDLQAQQLRRREAALWRVSALAGVAVQESSTPTTDIDAIGRRLDSTRAHIQRLSSDAS